MPSLQKIVASLAARVDQPFNVDLQEELKHIINYKRANYTQQFIQKNPQQRKLFLQKITAELEKVNKDDCVTVNECVIQRTKCKMPIPIRNSSTIFDFVGESTFVSGYGYQEPDFIQDIAFSRFTGKKPKWYYMDNRIYIYNSTTIERIGIRGVFEDPASVNACACDPKDCFKDTDDYPISLDLLNSIVRDILQVELGRPLLPEEEIAQDTIEQAKEFGLKPKIE